MRLWRYQKGAPIIKNSEIVEQNGRKFMREVRVPEHAGKWLAKRCETTSAQVTWNIKVDNLSDTLPEAVLKAVNSK